MKPIRVSISLCSVAVLMLGATACRTRLLVTDITHDDCTTVVDGIPFRVRETHTIRVFQWRKAHTHTQQVCEHPDKTCVVAPAYFHEVMTKEVAFPNQRRLFALNLRAEQHADYDLDLVYFPDNTLRKLTIVGEPQGEGFAAALGQVSAAAKAAAEAEMKIAQHAKAVMDARQEVRTAEETEATNTLAYLGLVSSLQEHCQTWEDWEELEAAALDGPTYKVKFLKFQQDARTMLKDAMLAAQKIGRTLYAGNPFTLSIQEVCALINSGPYR